MRESGTGQAGFILVSVLLAILVIAALAVLLNGGASDGTAAARSQASATRAHFVADAGLNHALWVTQRSNCQAVPPLTGRSFGPGSYSYSVSTVGGSEVNLSATGVLADGTSATVSRRNVPIVVTPTTATLEPGQAGEDTYIFDGSQATNFGNETLIRLSDKTNIQKRGLLRFDLSSIPFGATVLSAEIEMTLLGIGSGNAGTAKFQRVTTQWSEADATWLQARPGVLWASPGGDATNAIVANADVSFSAPGTTRFTVTDQVQAWVNGTDANFGLLVTASAGMNHVDFATGDDPNPAVHPRLTVTWACQCGKVCTLGPQPDQLLLVVANPASLSAQETDKKSLIESWGYAVTLIGESTNQNLFTSALADADVAYVPESVDATALGTKMIGTNIGVVIEKMSGNFNMATNWVSKSRDQVDIVDNTHYITSPYPTGVLTYLSSLQPVSMIDSGPAPDLVVLGTTFNVGSGWKPSLGVVNAGGTLEGGSLAAGRRVQLPWGDAGFDINALNTVGQDLMKRSIEWGRGVGAAATIYVTLNETADTYVYENTNTTNYGTDTQLMIGKDGIGSGKYYFSVMAFDLSAIPAGATVTSAKLRLYANAFVGSGTMSTGVYKMASSWGETTAKWANLSSASNYGPRLVLADTALGSPGWREWVLPPSLIEEWVSGVPTPNYGLAVKYEANAKNISASFASRENATTANRPQLVVGYTQ